MASATQSKRDINTVLRYKRKREKPTIWNHFQKLVVPEAAAKCMHCKTEYKTHNVTNPKRHLISHHFDELDADERQAFGSESKVKPPELGSAAGCRQALATMQQIVCDCLPFTHVESPYYRNRLLCHTPAPLVLNRTIVSNVLLPVCMNAFLARLQRVCHAAIAMGLTLDLWSNRAQEGYLGITAHFLDEDLCMQSFCIGCMPFKGRHLWNMVRDKVDKANARAGITNAIIKGIVTDNAANVVAAAREDWRSFRCVAHTLQLSLEVLEDRQKHREELKKLVESCTTAAVDDTSAEFAARRLLREVVSEAETQEARQESVQAALARFHEAVRCVKLLVNHFANSVKLNDALKQYMEKELAADPRETRPTTKQPEWKIRPKSPLKFIQHCATRWYSKISMIVRALRLNPFVIGLAHSPRMNFEELTPGDYKGLKRRALKEEAVAVLEACLPSLVELKKFMLEIQADQRPTMGEVLPWYDRVMRALARPTGNEVANTINALLLKDIKRRYKGMFPAGVETVMDGCRVTGGYNLAWAAQSTLLTPSLKPLWQAWERRARTNKQRTTSTTGSPSPSAAQGSKRRTRSSAEAKAAPEESKTAADLAPPFSVLAVSEDIIKCMRSICQSGCPLVACPYSDRLAAPPATPTGSSLLDDFSDTPMKHEGAFEEEWAQYLAAPSPSEVWDAKWWKKYKHKFQHVAMLARQRLCVPATSASSERLFSVAGRVCNPRRSSLGADKVENLTVMGFNTRANNALSSFWDDITPAMLAKAKEAYRRRDKKT